MSLGRPKAPLSLSSEQRGQVEALAASRSLPHGLVTRVRIILMSASGLTNSTIATQLGVTPATVGKWRQRFLTQGTTGLHDVLFPVLPTFADSSGIG